MKPQLSVVIAIQIFLSLGVVTTGFAQTPLNIAGSSAGRYFATDVPLNLCDASPLPTRWVNNNENLYVWTCNRGGLPVIFRFAGTNSLDGIRKVLQPSTNPASNVLFLDHTLFPGCTGPVGPFSRPSDGKQYNLMYNCSSLGTSMPVHIGASDVQGASFHQTGPIGQSVQPEDDSQLNSVATAIVPFSIFVGKGVVKVAPGSPPLPNGPITSLSRLQIEKIFDRSVADWTRLGLGTITDAAPGALEATSPIVLCLQSAGSGTKAAFDENIMINATETSLANASVIFSNGTSGVLSCIANHRRSIGYMATSENVNFITPPAFPSFNPYHGLGYQVGIDGAKANDPTLVDPKRDLKCGRYSYWTAWRLNRRSTSEGMNVDNLAQTFVDNASAQSTISIIPTGGYWASDEEMAVFKNLDRGPLGWKAGAHPECQGNQ